MKLNDAIFGLLFAALGIAVLLGVQGFPKIPGQPVGPALFPGLLAAGLVVCGLVLIVRGLRERRVQPWLAWEPWVRSPRHIAALGVLLGSILLYILASTRVGFLPLAFAILTAFMAVLRVPLRRSLVIAAIATLVVHFIFYKLLRVPLPWGLLTPWAW